MKIIHPFHPLCGQNFVYIGKRYCRYGARVLLQNDSGTLFGVPPGWTDLITPDPEVVIGGCCLVARLEDLLELMQLVTHLCDAKSLRGDQ